MPRLLRCRSVAAVYCTAPLLLVGCAGVAHAEPLGAEPADPSLVVERVISHLAQQAFDSPFWAWDYATALCVSAMYEVSAQMGQDWTRAADRRLDSFAQNASLPAYLFLHNVTPPFDDAIGNVNGLMPIAYLSRFQYYNESKDNSSDWQLALAVAERWIMRWPKHLPDGTFSRNAGWPGQPPANGSFVWSDDQFMGLAVIARLASLEAPNASLYTTKLATMQLTFAEHLQDSASGLFYHGYDYAAQQSSCCFWGRANGWALMAHVQTLQSLLSTDPSNPSIPQILATFQRLAGAMLAAQSADGRWHQVLNDASTYLETSVTAMTLCAFVSGVENGWLDREKYDDAIEQAWTALACQVNADGTVEGISASSGIQATAAGYQALPTTYATAQPGLGAVLFAAIAYFRHSGDPGTLPARPPSAHSR